MNYTEKYHLPQWEETDRIMRTDFNAAMVNLESGISGNAQAAANAQAKADAAYSPDQKPYVVGHYYGTGNELAVDLGFRPSFLIITSVDSFSVGNPMLATMYNGQTGGHALKYYITLTDTGFKVIKPVDGQFPHLSTQGRVYDYIAFR